MTRVNDYRELDRLRPIDGREALVRSSFFVYRAVNGSWLFVRRLRWEGCRDY